MGAPRRPLSPGARWSLSPVRVGPFPRLAAVPFPAERPAAVPFPVSSSLTPHHFLSRFHAGIHGSIV